MKKINLKCLYPDTYFDNLYIVVEDEVYKVLKSKVKEYDYRHISLDDIAIDRILYTVIEEITVRETKNILYSKLDELTLKQANRIYENYCLNISKTEIARIEECSEAAIRKSIDRGLKQLR